ncbi:MAG: cyclase family protein [Streptosporangiales bacterium]|nr:cyclase family protein [Streptosporangiales bacterium]
MPRFVDLSHEITDGMTTYPGLPAAVVAPHLTYDASHEVYAPGYEFAIARVDMVGNTGTYLDAPAHTRRGGADIADLPLDAVAGLPGVVVDATDQGVGPEAFAGVDVAGRAVLVRTGWDRHWGTERYGSSEHPFVTAEAAARLVEAGARLVGIDSLNVDDTAPATGGARPTHATLLAGDVLILEHLCDLAALGDEEFTLYAVPPRVRGMASFPVRAFARLG